MKKHPEKEKVINYVVCICGKGEGEPTLAHAL
jgi:hypothetical protein